MKQRHFQYLQGGSYDFFFQWRHDVPPVETSCVGLHNVVSEK